MVLSKYCDNNTTIFSIFQNFVQHIDVIRLKWNGKKVKKVFFLIALNKSPFMPCYYTKQHGFMEGRSCLSNLLETLDELTEAMERGDQVDLIYLHLKKKPSSQYLMAGYLSNWNHSA